MQFWDDLISNILSNIIAAGILGVISISFVRGVYFALYWLKYQWSYIVRRQELRIELSANREYTDASIKDFSMNIFTLLKGEFPNYSLIDPVISNEFLTFLINLVPNRIIVRIYSSDDEILNDSNSKDYLSILLNETDSNDIKEDISISIFPENDLFMYLSNEKINKTIKLFSGILGHIERQLVAPDSNTRRKFNLKVYSDFKAIRKKHPDSFTDDDLNSLVKFGNKYLQISTSNEDYLKTAFYKYFKLGKTKRLIPR